MFDSYSDSTPPSADDDALSQFADHFGEASDDLDDYPDGPSLPIILFCAACGVAAGIIGLYFAYEFFRLTLPASAGLGTLIALTVLSGSAIGFTRLIGSQAYLPNVSFSCGLLVLSTLFFCVCVLFGALFATMILSLGG